MNTEDAAEKPERKSQSNNHNSKKDIKADNYKKSKVFEVKLQNLSRVDSQNDPVETENLDLIADKMGLNQHNNSKLDRQLIEAFQSEKTTENVCPSMNTSTNPTTEEGSKKDHYKKSSLMVKILRRLSKPSIFSKDKKQKKTKNKSSPDSTRPSLSSDNKSNTVGENINHLTPRSNSFRKFFNRFGKGKSKNQMFSDPPNSIESRPSVSSAINPMTTIDCLGSTNDMNIDKLCRDTIEKYNSSSVDCILSHQAGKSLKKEESVSSNSEDLRDHERKMNSSNNHVVSIFNEEVMRDVNMLCNGLDINTSKDSNVLVNSEKDKLSPLKLNITPGNIDNDRSCHSAMSFHNNETSSNVKLTLSLHGYSAYGLSSSRFSSKSCMEFRSTCASSNTKASMDNLTIISGNLEVKDNFEVIKGDVTKADKTIQPKETETDNSHCCNDGIDDSTAEYVAKETDVVLRKSERPNEIQLRRSRVASQSSVARSSLIMVAVAHNTPRSKGVSNHVDTPVYNPDSPICQNKKMDFEEESKVIEEENLMKNLLEKDGNYFLQIANKYEEEVNLKIEIVQKYLDSDDIVMNDDVIGELNTAVGLAKLLLSEKFVQFRGLCDQNLNEPAENEFKTLTCDLEGYLTTLEIQMADLDKNFQMVDRIKENNWQMPLINVTSSNTKKKKQSKPKTPAKITPVDNKRTQEARKRLAEYKKISASNSNSSASLFIVQ